MKNIVRVLALLLAFIGVAYLQYNRSVSHLEQKNCFEDYSSVLPEIKETEPELVQSSPNANDLSSSPMTSETFESPKTPEPEQKQEIQEDL